jgi:hypothetical protein
LKHAEKKGEPELPQKKRTGVASVAFAKLRFQLIETCLCLFHLRF